MPQVHSTRVVVCSADDLDDVDDEGWGRVPGDGVPATGPDDSDGTGHDALIALPGGPTVAVLVADCLPVLLADPRTGIVAAVHAGRRGLLDGVIEATVARLVSLGVRPGELRAAVGPAAGACCYEVPEAMAEQAARSLPGIRAVTRAGSPSLDLRGGCHRVLAEAGVTTVVDLDRCTLEDDSFYSYRRAPVTGRFAGFVHGPGDPGSPCGPDVHGGPPCP